MNGIKAIVFDWGRTLFDSDAKKEFPESKKLLEHCKNKGYRLGLVSLVSNAANATLEERNEQISKSFLRPYFEIVKTVETKKDSLVLKVPEKDEKFDEVVKYFALEPSEILIVDDRIFRGVKYANHRGHPSVWVRTGKFADQLPNDKTGEPTYTVYSLDELMQLL